MKPKLGLLEEAHVFDLDRLIYQCHRRYPVKRAVAIRQCLEESLFHGFVFLGLVLWEADLLLVVKIAVDFEIDRVASLGNLLLFG